MSTEVSGKWLRAMATIAGDQDKVEIPVGHYVRLRPMNDVDGEDDPEEHRDVLDVMNDRVYLRVEGPGGADESVLLDRNTCKRVLPKDDVLIVGNQIRRPFKLALHDPDGKSKSTLVFPDAEYVAPDQTAKAAFSIHPERLKRLAAALCSLGCTSVQVILPKTAGAPIGFRSQPKDDDRVLVRAAIQPDDMFTARQGDEPEDGAPDPDSPLLLSGPAALETDVSDEQQGLPFTPDENAPTIDATANDSDDDSAEG